MRDKFSREEFWKFEFERILSYFDKNFFLKNII